MYSSAYIFFFQAEDGIRAGTVTGVHTCALPIFDTFEPKPDAGRDYCGPLVEPVATNVDGIRISQLLPKLARHADKYSILRSMTHGNNSHETRSEERRVGKSARSRWSTCSRKQRT